MPVDNVTKADKDMQGCTFIRSVYVTILSMIFLPKRPADDLVNRRRPSVVRGPQFEKQWVTLCNNSASTTQISACMTMLCSLQRKKLIRRMLRTRTTEGRSLTYSTLSV